MQIIKETLLLIVIVFNISCVSNKSNLNNLDFHKEFIDNYIIDSLEIEVSSNLLVFTINTSFCGSCTERVLNYYHQPIFQSFQKIYITDLDSGEVVSKILTIPNSQVQTIPIDDQERGGFFSTYNRIYVIKDDNIIYANYVTDNSLKDNSNFIRKL